MNEPSIPTEKALWSERTIQKIDEKTGNYSAREKKNTRIYFLISAIEKVTLKEEISAEEWAIFQKRTMEIVESLPTKSGQEKLNYGKSLKTITSFKTYVLKEFKYVQKGFYLQIWLILGSGLGLLIGVIFGYILPGISFGIGIGLIVGSYQDKKAKAADRVL